MWERRYGFPQPARTDSGRRRYSQAQADQVSDVLAARDAGLSLRAAIDRVTAPRDPGGMSLFATIRSHAPQLEARLIRKPALVALSHAIEDECMARAEIRVLFGCFQRERFYRQEQTRWRELAAGAGVAAVFADFAPTPDSGAGVSPARLSGSQPVEIPIAAGHPLRREWAVVCYGNHCAAALVGREPASSAPESGTSARAFETVWTVDPVLVRYLAQTCAQAASVADAAIVDAVNGVDHAALSPGGRLQLATAVIDRTLAGLS